MTAELFVNLAESTLAVGCSAIDTTVTLATGTGALFPNPTAGDWFKLVLDDTIYVEITKCTARTGDVCTITRAQEGTTARVFAAGTLAENRLTAEAITRLVGTGDTPTFAGATLTGSADMAGLDGDDDRHIAMLTAVGGVTHVSSFAFVVIAGPGYVINRMKIGSHADNDAALFSVNGRDGSGFEFSNAGVGVGNVITNGTGLDFSAAGTLAFYAGSTGWLSINPTTGAITGSGFGDVISHNAAEFQAAGSYVTTSDARLSDARPASDVSAWAKAATKPSYTYSEVGALALGGTAADSALLGTHAASYFAVAGAAPTAHAASHAPGGTDAVFPADAAGFLHSDGAGVRAWQAVTVPTGANRTQSAGLAAVNGSAGTFARSDSSPAIDQAIAPTWTAPHTFSQAIGATSTDGIVLSNPTAATVGAQKWSPRLHLKGSGWGTTGGAAQDLDFKVEGVPVQAGSPSFELRFAASRNGAAYNAASLTVIGGTGGADDGIKIGTAYLRDEASGQLSINRRLYILPGMTIQSGAVGGGNFWGFNGVFGNPADLFLAYGAAANLQLGTTAANPPIAQTLSVQDPSGTDLNGAVWTFRESRPTGSGKGGGYIWQLAPGGEATGTTLRTAVTAVDLGATTAKTLTFADAVNIATGTTTGSKLAATSTQKIGVWGATPIVQPGAITKPTGGSVIDTEGRTAIGTLVDTLKNIGLTA